MDEAYSKYEKEVPADPTRRNFLKAMSVLAVGAAVGGTARSLIQNIIPKSSGLTSFPTLTLVDSSGNPISTSTLSVNDPHIVLFHYPLQDEPNFLLRLGDSGGNDVEIKPATVTIEASGKTFQSPGGVGPYKSVVGSSAICQHLGCVPPMIHYYKPGTTIPSHPDLTGNKNPGYIHCNCHGSTYDPFKGFGIVTGPTESPLPNAFLNYDSSTDQYSVQKMIGPSIFGHTNDLTGGQILGSTSKTTVSVGSVPSM